MSETRAPSAASPARSGVAAAGLGRRIAAALVDLAVLTAVFVVMGILFGEARASDGQVGVFLDGWPALAFFVIALGYYFAPETAFGRTLGKALLGLRVVREDGGRAGAGAIAGRTALRLVDGLCFYAVGLVAVLATRERRARLGDLAARTSVVRS